ncbi:ABC transporter substrate-binding protein [Rhodoblastus sp.]|uniref:ABC transporter substrate-binding protein n=1 Tax=Rhodoblastus sp. TaxID=1962975 RepID=UPI0035B11DE1
MIARLFTLAFAVLIALSSILATPAQAREITDMAGRKVTVPDRITRVHSASYPLTVLFYVLAPDLLVAVNMPPNEKKMAFLPPEIAKLPALGGMPGHGPGANPEEVLALHPDLVVSWLEPMGENGETERLYGRTGLPIVYVRLNSIKDYPEALRFLGDLLDRRQRADQLAEAIAGMIARVEKAVASLPADKRIRYYYAEGPDGLATECANSFHVEAMRLAGGENIDQCEQSNHVGMERVSLEQIIAGKPSLILALDPRFKDMAAKAPEWRNVEAAAQGRIVTVPRLPFNWLDRPPSFMRALGALWLANLFYPELLPVDIKAETKTFYKTFFGVDLKDEDVDHILH